MYYLLLFHENLLLTELWGEGQNVI